MVVFQTPLPGAPCRRPALAQVPPAFYYYEGSDPIGNGVDVGHLAVLAAATTALVAFAALAIGRRDLRA